MDPMKDYKQLIKELPSKSVVFAFGRFNPPTIGHELLVKAVKKLAQQKKADHVIYASKSQDAKKNPLSVDKKVSYLKLMFKATNFAAANDDVRTFIEAAKQLNKKYKNIVMVAGSDRVPEFKRLLNTYNGKEFNFDTIEVISAGERDPDADDATGMSASKMRAIAVKGNYAEFKKGLPSTVREIDGKRLMNDIRDGMGLEPIKEQIVLVKDEIREQYFRGEIFNEGDIVESAGQKYTIVKRGSNHLLLKESTGKLVSKWIQDVKPTEEKQMNEELTDKTLKANDKIKVARVIASMLGIENAETSSNPENLINMALRKMKTKALNAESLSILDRMLNLATQVGIKYDTSLKPAKLKEGAIQPNGTDKIDTKTSEPMNSDQKTSDAKTKKGVITFFNYTKAQKIKEQADEKKDNESDHDYENKIKVSGVDRSTVGHALSHPDDSANLRRRKVKYHLGEEVKENSASKELAKANLAAKHAKEKESLASKHEQEKEQIKESNAYEKSEENKRSADAAKKQGDMFAHHLHMADHHDNLAQYHSEKGRHSVADSHAAKSEEHHDKAMKLKEEVEQIDEISSKLAGNYYGAATKKHIAKVGVKPNMYGRIEKDMGAKRKAGVDRAMDRITGARKTNEEAELDENHLMDYRRYTQAAKKAKSKGDHDIAKDAEQKASKAAANYSRVTGKKPTFNEESELEEAKKKPLVGVVATDKPVDPFFEDMDEYDQTVDVADPHTAIETSQEDDISDEEIEAMLGHLSDEEIMDEYDEDELALVDDETGEEIPKSDEEDALDEQAIMEVLSRMERMKAKFRIRRTAAKRQRATKIALKRYSNTTTINKRSRRLAIKLMKKRLLRGRDASKISVSEKERIERTLQKRKAIIGRLATRLAPRVRKVEKARMSHTKFTQGSPTTSF
jgi:nicotinic acid mononucleotide adenylyltransferase